MRLIFAGTPRFAELALEALLAAGHDVGLVLTQPDRPAGRGMRPVQSAVRIAAARHGLPVEQPATLRDGALRGRIGSLGAEVMVVVAYGLILPPWMLEAPVHGAINIHASLLPRWRGAAPIQHALLAGDEQTGVSIMRMDSGLDTGAVIDRTAIPVLPGDDAGSLHDRLAPLGATMIVQTLSRLADGPVRGTPQPDEGVTYAHKIERDSAHLDWQRPSVELERCVRAFRPAPGAWTTHGAETVKIWKADTSAETGNPGVILAIEHGALLVACGTGALRVTELQRAGARRMAADAFVRGSRLVAGDAFGEH